MWLNTSSVLETQYSVFVEFTLDKTVIDGEFEIPVVFNFEVNDTTLKFTIAREIVSTIII